MSAKKYDEDELQRFASIVAEQFESQLGALVENIDGRIEYHIQPLKDDMTQLKTDMKIVKAAVKDTNRDLQHKLKAAV